MYTLKFALLFLFIGALTQTQAQTRTRSDSSSYTLKHSHIHLGLVYPISTNGWEAREYINDCSVHAFGGISAGENSASIAGFANICTGTVKGAQVAGFLDIADSATVQVSGFFSKANRNKIQVAGFVNKTHTADIQVAGFVNITHKARVQIAGFINISDSCKYPVGLINIIRGGERSLSIATDETLTTMVTFRSGSRHLYGIIGTGYNGRNGTNCWAWEAGMGAHLLNFGSFRLKTEAVAINLTDFKKADYFRACIRAMPSYRLTDKIECFLGASVNYIRSEDHKGDRLITHYQWSKRQANGTLNAGYFGCSGGVAIIL